jgi:hypothetical protein
MSTHHHIARHDRGGQLGISPSSKAKFKHTTQPIRSEQHRMEEDVRVATLERGALVETSMEDLAAPSCEANSFCLSKATNCL